jgi:hypothetical protein
MVEAKVVPPQKQARESAQQYYTPTLAQNGKGFFYFLAITSDYRDFIWVTAVQDFL